MDIYIQGRHFNQSRAPVSPPGQIQRKLQCSTKMAANSKIHNDMIRLHGEASRDACVAFNLLNLIDRHSASSNQTAAI